MISRSHPLKTFSSQSELSNILETSFHVKDVFIEIEKEFVQAVVRKCQGNP